MTRFLVRKTGHVLERLPALALGLWLASCSDDGTDPQKAAVVTQYVAIVRANYDAAITGAKELRGALSDLVVDPSEDTLTAAREAWIAARPAYLQSEAFRFYEGPIDDADTGPEGRINAWPLDESFVDYVRDPKTNALIRVGIINDRQKFGNITKETLIAQNENGAEENIATGYHAIEFLLWGQDFDDNGPGARPFTDYVAGTAGGEPDADRRRQYLGLTGDLLVEDLEYVRAAWDDGAPYLKQFLANVDNKSLENIITGISYLANDELAAERIQPAYETHDQEDEHSCFSDTTDQDMKYDLVGIQNVYFGRFGELDGVGLEDLVKTADPALDARIKVQLTEAEKAIAAMPVPFDQAIRTTASLKKVRDAIDALESLNGSLSKLSTTLKL